jgi:hypothetical protein
MKRQEWETIFKILIILMLGAAIPLLTQRPLVSTTIWKADGDP